MWNLEGRGVGVLGAGGELRGGLECRLGAGWGGCGGAAGGTRRIWFNARAARRMWEAGTNPFWDNNKLALCLRMTCHVVFSPTSGLPKSLERNDGDTLSPLVLPY